MRDIWTIIWKEWRDVLFQGGGWRSWVRPAIMVAVVGIYLPLQLGRPWLTIPPIELFVLLWIPFFLVISFVADSFAGERERHTLETLLASRMPDRAILLGKVAMVVLYCWGIMLVSLALGLVLVNLTSGQGGWAFYPLDKLLGAVALCLALNTLAATAGVIVSLRSSTARQAQQMLSIGTLIITFGGGFALNTLAGNSLLRSMSVDQLMLLGFVLVAVIDLVLLGLAIARFQRARLILS